MTFVEKCGCMWWKSIPDLSPKGSMMRCVLVEVVCTCFFLMKFILLNALDKDWDKTRQLKMQFKWKTMSSPCRHSISLLGINVSWRWGINISFEMHDSFSGSAWLLAGHEYLPAIFKFCEELNLLAMHEILRGMKSSHDV